MTHKLPWRSTWSNYDVIVCWRKSIPKVILAIFQKRPILSKLAKFIDFMAQLLKFILVVTIFRHFPCSNERDLYLSSILSWAVLYTRDISILKSFEAPLKTGSCEIECKQSNKQSGTFLFSDAKSWSASDSALPWLPALKLSDLANWQ